LRTLEFAGPSPRVRGRVVSALLVSALAVALAYVASALPPVDPAAPAANLEASRAITRSTQVEEPIAAAPADAPSRGPLLRVYLMQPVPYEGGLPVFQGYVRNDHASNLSNLRMEITYADGSVATYPIAAALAPGEQVTFEFRSTRTDLAAQPKFFFSFSR
jgi:hypothetical protein